MTFAIAAWSEAEDKFGFCQSTSTPAVGHRYGRVIPGLGVVVVQAALGFATLDGASEMLQRGQLSAADILQRLEQQDPRIDSRQIAIVRENDVAIRAGQPPRQWAGVHVGSHWAVMGNVVVGPQVIQSMANAFEAANGQPLEQRLLCAIEAGRDAGGEANGQHSSVLSVSKGKFPSVDLRVDWHQEPVGELRRLFDWYAPLIPYYESRNAGEAVPPWRDFLAAQSLPVAPSDR